MGLLGKTIGSPEAINEEANVASEQEQVTEKKEETTEHVAQTDGTAEDSAFSFEAINKRFGREFKDEDEIKSVFDKAGKYEEVLSDLQSKEDKISELEKLTGKLNPRSWFANDDEYVKNQFLINKKDSLSEAQIDALKGISPSNVDKLSPQDALKVDFIVNKGLSPEEAEALVETKYGDVDEEDKGAIAQMKLDATSAKNGIKELYKGIDVPEQTDYIAKASENLNKIKGTWDTSLSEATKGLTEIKISEDFTFKATEQDLKSAKDFVYNQFVNNGVQPSEEMLSAAMSAMSDRIVLNNLDKILKARDANMEEVYKEKFRKEVHNDGSLNTNSRESATQDSNVSKLLKHFG